MKPVQLLAQSYYARKDVQQVIYEFCKNRETVPNFNKEFYGKRPDALDYPLDILNYAKKGATSFHCSEELWENPLTISKDMTPEQYAQIRTGWDFLIDIDSKYFDYSRLAARLIIKALEYHGVKNIGIKFSGNKGMHIIIPWKSFPKEVNGELTKDKFPEWPRLIAGYIHELIAPKLNEEIFKISNKKELEKKGELIQSHLCPQCKNTTIEQKVSIYRCKNCKTETKNMKSSRNKLRCPSCNYDMEKINEIINYVCPKCNINAIKSDSSLSSYGGEIREIDKVRAEFSEHINTKSAGDSVDIILVAPRHLFRAPYSLHEKTCLASVVIDKNEIADFNPAMANTLKIKIKNFIPDSQENEAQELLLQALDWAKRKNIQKPKYEGKSIDIKNLKINESMFPPCICHILKGIKQDGRKRALFILLAFLNSLKLPQDFIQETLEKWNKKNYKPLASGYIQSQSSWFEKNRILPPNCDKPQYKELGIPCSCTGIKNPINYTIKQAFKEKVLPLKKDYKIERFKN